MADDLSRLDAVAQAELVRAGALSPLDLVDAAIDRIERTDPDLNAVIHPRFERAREEAAGDLPDGPFRGVPIVLKDYDGMSAGDPFHAGNVLLRDQGFVADHDSELTARLRRAGFVIVGRANTPELGLVVTTEPQAYGATRNPWNTERSTGGSSGGSAAAVASGMVPLAQAGDGGGSIRIPASECGLVGLKPARARHSFGPEVGESWGGLVVRGAVTRTVRDTAAFLDVIEGALPGDPYVAPRPAGPYRDEVGRDPGRLRIGVLTRAPDANVHTHPDCVAAVGRAAELLAASGHHVEETYPPAVDDDALFAQLSESFMTAFGVWTARQLDQISMWTGHEVTESDVEPATWFVAELGRAAGGVQHAAALDFFHEFTRRVVSWWSDGHDLLLTPVLTEPPPRLGEFTATDDDPLRGLVRASGLVPFTVPFNITGQPAVSLPLHWNDDGMPIGVQLVADQWREDVLIRVAAQLEDAAPWADRRPTIHA